jgi:hypothetical protein
MPDRIAFIGSDQSAIGFCLFAGYLLKRFRSDEKWHIAVLATNWCAGKEKVICMLKCGTLGGCRGGATYIRND